jgi:23S rRNA U2552 (ribose-2'-O)-methylase RlmE/FtsJ
MEQIANKVHFEIPMNYDIIVWNDPSIIEVPPDANNYIRVQLFNSRMMQLERELTSEKMKIEKIKRSLWDYFKKIINPYEYVHLNKPFNHKCTGEQTQLGVANYEPISRAYYKLWEILHDFPVARQNSPMRYAALAEGPGGFIEAFFHYRRFYVNSESMDHIVHSNDGIENIKDKAFAITLCDTKKPQIPGWKKSQEFLQAYKDHIHISYGEDGTGNLYSIENINHFCQLFEEEKADFVSADGGFDFSDDYTNQEKTLYRLLLAEIIIGLRILRKGGAMVIKLFDFMNVDTIEILYLLSCLFRKSYITKPFTSRVMNSEKYIVATGFLEIDKSMQLCINQDQFDTYIRAKQLEIIRHIESQFVKRELSIIRPYTIPVSFIDTIERCNVGFGIKQLFYLSKTFQLVDENISSQTINEFKKDQCVYGLSWCKKYNYPIHTKSRLFKEIDAYHYIPIF